jgi:hypothetical protein
MEEGPSGQDESIYNPAFAITTIANPDNGFSAVPPLKLKIHRRRRSRSSETEFMAGGRTTRAGAVTESTFVSRNLRSRSGNSGNGTNSPDSLSGPLPSSRLTRSGRTTAAINYAEDDEDDEMPVKQLGRRPHNSRSSQRIHDDFIDSAEEDDEAIISDAEFGRSQRSTRRSRPQRPKKSPSKKRTKNEDEDGDFELNEKSGPESDEDSEGQDYDAIPTSPSPVPSPRHVTTRPVLSPRGYTLRPQRREINYQIPPPLDTTDQIFAAADEYSRSTKPRPRAGLGRSLSQAFLDNLGALPPPPPVFDDSDSDDPSRPHHKPPQGAGDTINSQSLLGTGNSTSADLAAAAGAPANFGKVSKDSCTLLSSTAGSFTLFTR